MPRAIEILTLTELAEAAVQLQYMNVVCIDNDWYERPDILREIDRRVMTGKITKG